jgi:DNA-binding IclR family transcriptional regulator
MLRSVQQPRAARATSLRRGLAALELLASGPRTAAALARDLEINRSTALRLLRELEAGGYVTRSAASKRFALVSSRFHAILARADGHADWTQSVNPVLERLRDETGESTLFAIPAHPNMVYVVFFPSTHAVAVRERVGTMRPMHASALGKAYLSALESSALELELRELSFAGGTSAAAKNAGELRAMVAGARDAGYALDREETFAGVACVAVPVTIGGAVIGAASVSGPASRISQLGIEMLGEQLIDAFRPFQTRRCEYEWTS